MNKIIKFSVIIPVYNVAPYLRACLDSVLFAIKQVIEKENILIEIICVNDGSTDGSDKILTEYIPLFNKYSQNINYQIQSQINKGIGATRNKGLEKAQGEWILFVDSDDIVATDYFITLFNSTKKYNSSLIYFSLQEIYSLDELNLNQEKKLAMHGMYLERSKRKIYLILNSATACNICYRRDVIASNRFVNITPGEDNLFNSSILSNVEGIVIISHPLYYYLQRPSSLMHQKKITLKQIESSIISCRERIYYAINWKDYSRVKKELYKMVRTTYIGQVGLMLLKTGKNQKEAWLKYCDFGQKIYNLKSDYLPYTVRVLGLFVFKIKSYLLWKFFFFWPWKMRVFVGKFIRGIKS